MSDDLVLITTTVSVPHVLELYRSHGPDVHFIVAGDRKSPHEEIVAFLDGIGGSTYLPPMEQEKWKCSELIGWNCIQRRNIALLEALQAGAEVIVTIDDDNLPMSMDYFDRFRLALGNFKFAFYLKSAHLELTALDRWVDHGKLLLPPQRHRGIPVSDRGRFTVRYAFNRQVGVVTGAVFGDPDISAVDRMANAPHVHGPSALLEEGVTIDPNSWTVFNTQNTAFLRKFAPAMFCPPGVGRMDDIIASLVCQRVMREEGYAVHVGKPFVYQQRNSHNLVDDLRAEIDWYDKIDEFTEMLESVTLKTISVIDRVREIYNADQIQAYFSDRTIEAALAWCDDCEEVMK
jgi:hypothetical protein